MSFFPSPSTPPLSPFTHPPPRNQVTDNPSPSTGSHPYPSFALESLTTIFHLSGFIALAVFLSKLLFCRGSVCNAARVDVGAASFGFVLWVISTVVMGMEIFKGGFRRAGGVGGGKVEMRGVGGV
jgi:hypothetical protein